MLHQEARSRICLGCMQKCTRNLLDAQPLTLQRLNDHVIQHIDVHDSRMPIGFCESCRLRLKRISENGAKAFDLSHLHSYLKQQKRIMPRVKECKCLVCQLASSSGGVAKKLQRFQKSSGRPSNEPRPVIHRLCGKCHTPLFSGCNHSCNNSTLVENILSSCPTGVLDQIASKHLKSKMEASESNKLTLKTFGTPMPVTIRHDRTEPTQFSHEQMDFIQAHSSFTGEQMKKCKFNSWDIRRDNSVNFPSPFQKYVLYFLF